MPSPAADYGVDAPYVPVAMAAGGTALLALAATHGVHALADALPLLSGLSLFACAASFVYTTRRGKRTVWSEIVGGLGLRGDERVLDVGCGRGLVLVQLAKALPRGRAVGVDLWRTQDQSGNATDTTRRNADAEGVADRVEIHTGDMRELPFESASFDLVVSSLAIHNVPDPPGRARAVQEAARVLRAGGRIVLADFRATNEYAGTLRALGMQGVQERSLGWRFWYGGPWAATKLVTATKPA